MIRLPLRTLTLLPAFALAATVCGEVPRVPPTSVADQTVPHLPAEVPTERPADLSADDSDAIARAATSVRSMELVWNLGESSTWEHCLVYDTETGEPTIDAACFLEMVVERYRTLVFYRDRARVVRIISSGDEPPRRVETRVDSTLVDGKVDIRTPRRQMAGAIANRLPFRTSPAMKKAQQRFDTWLAPHMALARPDETKGSLSVGAGAHVSITDAGAAMINDRPVVHLELTSGEVVEGVDQTRLDLYVDPESMLVERIEGHRRSEDGEETTCITYEIETVYVEDAPDDQAESEDPPAGVAPPIG